ncbi:MAG TPA: hypothetical protein VJW51_14675, partial [Candidatus Acidoferrales bacterium]|nr:hypothetical protein [Candidatus Acidoferrales bacterium]
MVRVRRFWIYGLLPFLLAGLGGCGSSSTPTPPSTTTPTPALALSSITLSPATVNGGKTVTATVSLNGPAPTGGVTLTLSSSSDSAVLPSIQTANGPVFTKKILEGATSVTFQIQTLPVGSTQTVLISAANGTEIVEANLTIVSTNPLSLTGFTTSATSVMSGQTVIATVTLNAPAYSPGQPVFIASSDMSLVQPQNPVTVATNTTTVTFSIFTSPVGAQRMVTLTATLNTNSITLPLTLMPTGTAITSLLVLPYTVAGGQSMSGTLTISPPAPAGGVTVALTAVFTNPATPITTPLPIAFPATVQVPAGSAQTQFTITSTAVTATTDVTITASLNTTQGLFTVEIVPALTLAGINCQLISVTSGDTDACSVTLSIPAPAGGQAVQLASSYPTGLTVPAMVTVPAGASSYPLNLVAGNVTAPSIVTLTANLPATPAVTVTATVTVVSVGYLTLTNFTVTPTILEGGAGLLLLPCSPVPVAACGTVALSSPGPPGGIAINLTSSDPSVQLPNGPTVTVLQYATVATFPITTTMVAAQTNVTLTASVNFSTSKVSLTVVPAPVLTGISLAQNSVAGGNSVQGTVTLATVAPQSGVVVTLCASTAVPCTPQNSSNLAQVATTVSVPAGSSSATFSVTTLPVTTQQCGSGCNVIITATVGANSQQAMLTITPPPPDLKLLYFNPPTVTTGQVSTGTVTLTAPAPTGGVLVFLVSNTTSVIVPASILVPAGATSTTFPAKAASGVTTTTTAQVNGTVIALATNTLTVIPAQTSALSEQLLVTGETNSTDFPVHAASGSTVFQSTLPAGDDTGFLTSIALNTPTSGPPTSSLTFSTYLGGMSSFGQVR